MKFEKRKQCLSEIYVPLVCCRTATGTGHSLSQSHRTDEVLELVEAHWDFSHKGDGRNAQTPNMSEPIAKIKT